MTRRQINTRIAGVGHDGRSEIVRRHVQAGTALDARREPENVHDRNAISLWVKAGGIFGFGARPYQVGFLPADVAETLSPLIDQGALQVLRIRVSKVEHEPGYRAPRVDIVVDYSRQESTSAEPARVARPTMAPAAKVVVIALADVDWTVAENIEQNAAVKLWLRPNTDTVHVYASGGIGGSGLIGKTNDKRVVGQLTAGLPCAASARRNGTTVQISCSFPTRADVDRAVDQAQLQVAAELTAPYRAKKLQEKLRCVAKGTPDIRTGDIATLQLRTANEWAANGVELIFRTARTNIDMACRSAAGRQRVARAAINGYAVSGAVAQATRSHGGDREAIWEELEIDLLVTLVPPAR